MRASGARPSRARAFCLTGTPGTGKKSIAPLVAKNLGLSCVSLNDLAESTGTVTVGASGSEVDTEGLKMKLRGALGSPALVYGHLVPYAIPRGSVAKVAVLRCEPEVLKTRLCRRGYPRAKVMENVEAELIGLVFSDSVKAFGSEKVVEFDTTSTETSRAAESVAHLLRAGPHPRPTIDWTRSYDSASKLRSLFSGIEDGSGRT